MLWTDFPRMKACHWVCFSVVTMAMAGCPLGAHMSRVCSEITSLDSSYVGVA